MFSRAVLFLLLGAALFVNPSYSYAEEGDDAVEATQQALEDMQNADPADLVKAQAKALQDKVSEMVKHLSMDESKHFFVLYANYTVYSLVKAVRDDVSFAVSECSTKNPAMASGLNSRFAEWEENIGSLMKESYTNIESLGMAQTYIPQSELKLIFNLIEEVRAQDSSQFEKIPLTTPEACQFMLSKLDETQQSMQQMLQLTLVSYPNVLQQMQK
ncbi:MAG: hypothetical protein ACRBDL_10465 [Alphaproteobacteria bacterium]